jgi:hypothetical protein
MDKQIHVLLMGSKAFAKAAAAPLESCDNVDTLHIAHVTIDLFLAEWRPDCAVINCDDLEHELLGEIEDLSRFQSEVTIILVSSGGVSPLAVPAAAAILFPSEMQLKLAPLVMLLMGESHASVRCAKCSGEIAYP